jgi:hypothetical protein
MMQKDEGEYRKWHDRGYEDGDRFARQEADYDELAAIYKNNGIPENWDIYRAEILNRHLGDKSFNFKAYEKGFTRACIEFYTQI